MFKKKRLLSGAWSSRQSNGCTSAQKPRSGAGTGLEGLPYENSDAHALGVIQTSITVWAFVA